jgi:hypothetical protein
MNPFLDRADLMQEFVRQLNIVREEDRKYKAAKKLAKLKLLDDDESEKHSVRIKRGQSQAEIERPAFLAACDAIGLARPVAEHEFALPRGWRFDYAWPAHKVALEVQGGVFMFGGHTDPSGFAKDMEKWNAAAERGWLVTYCIPGWQGRTAKTKVKRLTIYTVLALLDLQTARMVQTVIENREAVDRELMNETMGF